MIIDRWCCCCRCCCCLENFYFRTGDIVYKVVCVCILLLLLHRTGKCVGSCWRRTSCVTLHSGRLRSQSERWICASARSAFKSKLLDMTIVSRMLMFPCYIITFMWYHYFVLSRAVERLIFLIALIARLIILIVHDCTSCWSWLIYKTRPLSNLPPNNDAQLKN